MTDVQVRDNEEAARFEASTEGRTATLDYELDGDRIRLTHTRVPPELEGRGVGSSLARYALDAARDRGLTVVPDCDFIAAFIRRHPDYRDLVAGSTGTAGPKSGADDGD